jgi:cytochrome c oxidase assembly factor CtaG
VPSLLDLATRWQLDPGLLASAVTVLAAYGWGVARVGRVGAGRWPPARTAAFALGVAAVLVALLSGLDGYADELLSIHMVQHLALALVAAPLLVAGAPVALALRALPRGGRRTLGAALRSRVVRALTHPLTAWTLFAGTMLATHLTGIYELALRHPAVHAAEHLAYLATAMLFWLPLLAPEPLPHRLGPLGRLIYLLAAMPAMAFVGVVLAGGDAVRYPAYVAPARALGISAVADQHAAGMLMWVGGSLLAAGLTVGVAWSALLREERRAAAREAYLDGVR